MICNVRLSPDVSLVTLATMVTRRKNTQSVTLISLLLTAGMLSAAPFAAPREGPVAFRRDRVPLDVGTMANLSDELSVLAHAQKLDSPRGRRTTAQILALALALNPANADARSAVEALSKGGPLREPEKRQIDRSKARVWHTLSWLEMPESGSDGQALGACLADVIAAADSEHPKAAAILDAGERGAWNQWIPALAAYDEAKLADNKQITPAVMPGDPVPAAPIPAITPAGQLALTTATISTPLWAMDKTAKVEKLAAHPVRMTATIRQALPEEVPVPPMTFTIDLTPESRSVTKVNRALGPVLAKQFGQLPLGSHVAFSLGEDTPYSTVKDREAISGAAAVLMNAALSGKEPVGTVIGIVDETGAFKGMPDFWDRLRSLSKGPGGRLVIPLECAEFLPSVLAMEDPEFFLKYDVLLASNLAELTERSAKAPASPLAEILTRFGDVRAKAGTVPIGQYVGNRFVRQRLVELSGEMSHFASPRMLAVQAAGERPTRIPRKVMAAELRRAIRPLASVSIAPMASVDLALLDKTYDSTRAEVDRLERYLDNHDRDLFLKVRDMTTTLRAFSRASRVGVNRDNGSEVVANAYEAMRKAYPAVIADLNTIMGDQEATPAPDPTALPAQ